jgi:hypothetical protein
MVSGRVGRGYSKNLIQSRVGKPVRSGQGWVKVNSLSGGSRVSRVRLAGLSRFAGYAEVGQNS